MSTSEQIRDQAAAWADMLYQRSGDLDLRREFERWRNADPEHARAYAQIDGAYRLTRTLAAGQVRHRLRDETLARVAQHRRRRRGRRVAGALAAGLVVGLAAMLGLDAGLRDALGYQQARAWHALQGETLYRTAPGQRETVRLADGSQVTLNTDSRVAVGYRAQRRDVTLLRGQALFEVARDPQRPFTVQAGTRRITALGTAFDVNLAHDAVAVTLIEGRISVEDLSERATDAASSRTSVLSPGEQLVAQAAAPQPVIRKADLRRATSWREGLLLFEGESLAQAIAEVNRYGGPRIELADETLGSLRISGAFKTGKPDAFVETLSWYLPIRVVESDGRRIVVAART